MLELAVGIGVLAALMGDRTAFALLASAYVSDRMQSPYWQVWLGLDLMVLAVVLRQNMGTADKLICLLFPVAWVSYCLPDWDRYNGALAVVVLQLLLTFPVGNLQKGLAKFSHGALRQIRGA